MKTSKLLLLAMCFLSLQISAQKINNEEEKTDPTKTVSLENLITQKSLTYVITKEHVSSLSGIRHIYLRQAINGLEVYGTESSVHIDKTGKAIMTHNNFQSDIQATVKSASQSLSAEQAIAAVANQMGYKLNNRLQQLNSEGGINKKALFNKVGISSEEIPVKLMYYYRKGLGTILVWQLSIAELSSSDWWNFRVDAATGKIIDKDNWTHKCFDFGEHNHESSANVTEKIFPEFVGPANNTTLVDAADGIGTYNVYPMPIESPHFGTRSTVVGPENLVASPFRWHDTDGIIGAEFTNTRGNNVSAWDDEDANDAPDGAYTASPGGDLVFDFTLNTTYSAGTQSKNAATTNLFYWNNIIHDVLYQYGFDEVAGNFQENNYGKGGLGGDSVNALAQSGLSTCNANFGTPDDGTNPRMRMYVCDSRDGDLDNWVIVHEYGHGIHSRLATTSGQERMNEGWSDYYGLMLTMQSTDDRTTGRGFATWLLGQAANGPGWRTQRYSTDFAVNSYTYDDIKTEAIPWGVGSVWAMMLWEMTWELIDVHGFDPDFYNGTGGNNISLALVTEALKLQAPNAGFVDGRDAILAADQALYGGANRCAIWSAFARRGLGVSADQGTSASKTDGTEAFDTPDPPVAVCVAPFSIVLDANLEASITAADIDNGSTDTCGIVSMTVSPNSFTCADVGDVLVTLTVTDTDGNVDTCSTTITIEKHPTTLTYNGDLEGQYTDPATLSATLLDADGFGIDGKTINFTIGTQSTSAITDGNGDASVVLILDQNPGSYTVAAEFVEDACYVGSSDSDPFDITQEDAIVEYTGHTIQATPNTNATMATVWLSANIQEVFDGYPGDIRNATVTFVDRENGDAVLAGPIAVVDLFDPSDPSIGTVGVQWDVFLGNLSSKSYTVGIVVGGCYTRDDSADDTIVTVYVPVGDFVTGGGFINPDNSVGSYASTPGLKLNFGYNIGYNRNGKRLKGHMNIIFRILQADGVHTYQIKSNAIKSLGVNIADESNKVAEFKTKANLTDVTDPLNPVSIDGNLILSVDMSDRGEPGIDDSISFNLITTDGILLYSSNWSGIATEEMQLSGGNLVVHSGFSLAALASTPEVRTISSFTGNLSMYPNPTKDQVILSNPEKIELNSVSIYNLEGRLIKYMSLEDMGVEKLINVSDLSNATYLVIINSTYGRITKQLIKE